MQSSLEEFTKNELNRLLEIEKESGSNIIIKSKNMTAQEYINDNIMKLMQPVFSLEDRSPNSMKYLLQVIYSLSQFEPISPLTLADNEFEEISRSNKQILYRNKRNPNVWKEVNYKIYHTDGDEALNKACGIIKDEPKYEQLDLGI